MLSSLSRTYLLPDMRTDVIKFVSGCDSCQQIKIDTKVSVGRLQTLTIPDCPWSVIGIDFVVKLPLSNGFDSILVIIDHLTKGAHFIPWRESMNTTELETVFIQQFFCLHGLPDKIVSDQGPPFVLALRLAVQHSLHIRLAPSTAYHQETYGQTKRLSYISKCFYLLLWQSK